MVFSTSAFVFLFLPAFLACYYITPWRGKSYVLLAGSYLFYGWWRVEYLLLIFTVSLVTFLCAEATRLCTQQSRRKTALICGVAFDIGILAYFKYQMFFLENVNGILTFAGGDGVDVADVLLPIGISFHTFQSVSYLVDIYRRDAPPPLRLVDFLAFSAMFPQLIAGPVLRYKDLALQFVTREHSAELFTTGMYRFVMGLAMKVLVADTLAPLADRIFALPAPTLIESWLGVLAYTFQIFFDFAGYSAMAIGLGLMIGFRFVENFNRPYISRSITEFWRRWHISLSNWMRDYLYVPLGGNRRGARRTYINLILTMVLGGLWHGANWTFVLWGLWHGSLMALERRRAEHIGSTAPRPTWYAIPVTFVLVMLGWVLFRAASLTQALALYKGMLGLNGLALTPQMAWQITVSELAMIGIAAALVFGPVLQAWGHVTRAAPARAVAYLALFVLASSRMASHSYSPFLYFQF